MRIIEDGVFVKLYDIDGVLFKVFDHTYSRKEVAEMYELGKGVKGVVQTSPIELSQGRVAIVAEGEIPATQQEWRASHFAQVFSALRALAEEGVYFSRSPGVAVDRKGEAFIYGFYWAQKQRRPVPQEELTSEVLGGLDAWLKKLGFPLVGGPKALSQRLQAVEYLLMTGENRSMVELWTHAEWFRAYWMYRERAKTARVQYGSHAVADLTEKAAKALDWSAELEDKKDLTILYQLYRAS